MVSGLAARFFVAHLFKFGFEFAEMAVVMFVQDEICGLVVSHDGDGRIVRDFGKTSTHVGAEWWFSAHVLERSIVNIAVSFTVMHLAVRPLSEKRIG